MDSKSFAAHMVRQLRRERARWEKYKEDGMCDYPLEIRDAARPLTVDELKIMKPHTIFAHGLAVDDYCEKLGAGINLTGSKITLRWVAVRGGRYYDWAVYAHLAGQDLMFIALYGDKVGCESNIRGVVPCDDDAYALYRF